MRAVSASALVSASPVAPSRCLRLLLCEDNEVNVLVIEAMLGPLGHEVVVAHNGIEGLACLASGQFDLVLMDMQMPELDGVAATRRWREIEQREGACAHAHRGPDSQRPGCRPARAALEAGLRRARDQAHHPARAAAGAGALRALSAATLKRRRPPAAFRKSCDQPGPPMAPSPVSSRPSSCTSPPSSRPIRP